MGDVRKEGKRADVVALIRNNPISALNAAMIIFGGGVVWATNDARMTAMERQIALVEISYKQADHDLKERLSDARAQLEAAEGRNAGEIKSVAQQMSIVSAKITGIETSVRFLVDQQRRRPND